MNCAEIFGILRKEETNIFSKVEKPLFKQIRKTIISAILSTDIGKSQTKLKELILFFQTNEDLVRTMFVDLETPDGQAISDGDRERLLNSLLFLADNNHPLKSAGERCMEVSRRIMEEAFVNGDVERNKGIPVQKINDRDRRDDEKFHIAYIEHVVTPYLLAISNIFPTFNQYGVFLAKNTQMWFVEWEKKNSEASHEEVTRFKRKVLGVGAICREMRDKDTIIQKSLSRSSPSGGSPT